MTSLGSRLKLTITVFLAVLAGSYLPGLEALNSSLVSYIALVWWAVALGLLLGGCIDFFVPDGFVVQFLGRRQRWMIPNAALAGLLMSACSHGILAIAMQLHKKGASGPAVVTFLLASPWANLPMTALLFGFFGYAAFLFVGGAILIALVSGYLFIALEKLGWIEPSAGSLERGAGEWSNLRDFRLRTAIAGVASGALSLANMVLWWILIGILAAAMIGAYVPSHWFMQFLGPDAAGALMTLLFATVVEVCSEGTSPIAFEIYDQVGVLGNPFIFLMAGVATDYTEIGLIWSNIGRRTAIWLPLITVPQVFALGMLLNSL